MEHEMGETSSRHGRYEKFIQNSGWRASWEEVSQEIYVQMEG